METSMEYHDMQSSFRNNNNLLTINTNGLCLVCFKECQAGTLSESKTSIHFCQILARYVGMNFRNIIDSKEVKGRVDVSFFMCLDCSALANQFLCIYQKYELNQMKLNLCAETLCKIMKSAERIPSRVLMLRQRFRDQEQEITNTTIQKGLSANERKADMLRKEIISKCRQKTSSCLPRVLIENNLNTENRLVPYYPRKAQEAALMMSMLGCIRVKGRVILSPIKRRTRAVTPQKRVRSPAHEIVSLEAGPRKCVKLCIKKEASPGQQQPTIVKGWRNQNSTVMSGNVTNGQHISESKPGSSKRRNGTLLVTKDEAVEAVKALWPLSQVVDPREPVTLQGLESEMENRIQTLPPNCGIPQMAVVPSSGTQNYVIELVKVENDELLNYSDTPTTNLLVCHLCSLQFDSRAKIEKHRAVTHLLARYVQCPVCSHMFSSYSHLQNHRIEDNNGHCQISDTMKKYELMDIARPLFPYSDCISGNNFCPSDDCYEVFESNELLQIHIKTHGNFQCSFCAVNFSKGYDVAIHEVNMTCVQSGAVVLASSPEAKLYKCTRCQFSHLQPEQFVGHFLNEHLHVSPFVEQCCICHEKFSTESASKLHFATHHGIVKNDPDAECESPNPEMSNECVQCNKSFGSSMGLRIHMTNSRVHQPKQTRKLQLYSGTKYFCEHCDYISLYAGEMKNHKITTHPIQHFAYGLPPGTTIRKFNEIVNKIISHCKEEWKCVCCPICSKKFRYRNILRNHILISHSNKVLEKLKL
ncbi:unnamed protein product [Orchesella dallaii]|uniref:C2H2-type domain-containing protein n=1 Tax=Orchesella dallaii TaxID=48710 RepID=A0ABP1RZ68_9HEXA